MLSSAGNKAMAVLPDVQSVQLCSHSCCVVRLQCISSLSTGVRQTLAERLQPLVAFVHPIHGIIRHSHMVVPLLADTHLGIVWWPHK